MHFQSLCYVPDILSIYALDSLHYSPKCGGAVYHLYLLTIVLDCGLWREPTNLINMTNLVQTQAAGSNAAVPEPVIHEHLWTDQVGMS